MDDKTSQNFKEELLKICENEDIGMLFITDDWTIGYTLCCEECGGIKMEYTPLEIPFDTGDELDELVEELEIELEVVHKAHHLYDSDEILCHCDEDGYTLNDDGEWEHREEDDCLED